MKRVRGDPATQADALREVSPAYQYERLKQPLLLIHGTSDVRVSFEHAWRMRTLLAGAGRPPTWLPLPGADH
ncbi:MAG TPA: prolyl oligopeptidase family serine peptidase, partial [Tahibacter sp.]|nr:prolyl oligopeptidase family serine peptidase [Tahibacter sp.]